MSNLNDGFRTIQDEIFKAKAKVKEKELHDLLINGTLPEPTLEEKRQFISEAATRKQMELIASVSSKFELSPAQLSMLQSNPMAKLAEEMARVEKVISNAKEKIKNFKPIEPGQAIAKAEEAIAKAYEEFLKRPI